MKLDYDFGFSRQHQLFVSFCKSVVKKYCHTFHYHSLFYYRENFMRLDIFMQELSYEEITQQKAYNIPRLLGS